MEGTFDQIESTQDFALMDPSEEAITEETQLDEVDIPGLPLEESERRAKWRAVPQRIRVAIRRPHRQFGHCPKKVLINLLPTAKIDKSYIDAANFHRCNQCEDAQPRRNAHTVSLPERYSFNHALGIDVFESLDARGDKYQVLNLVCLGTCFQLTEIVREGDGLPSSAGCLEAIQRRWTCWAGLPTVLRCDRGLHNRGVLAQFCAAHGIQVSHAPLETPEAIGESGATRWCTKGDGEEGCCPKPRRLGQVNSKLSWVSVASPRTRCFGTGDIRHHSGYLVRPRAAYCTRRARKQRRLSCIWTPPNASKEHFFGMLSHSRTRTQSETWSASGAIRPVRQNGLTASRVIGFEGTHNESVWVLCQNVPVLVSAQNLRPAQDAEALAQDRLFCRASRSYRTVSHAETSGKTSRICEAYRR